MTLRYEPTTASLATHPLPAWWSDAKLGIFVHWTVASIPAFAPVGPDPFTLNRERGERAAFVETPYAEWYQNSLQFPDSPVAEHHAATYGDRPYDAFVPEFFAASAGWDPGRWGRLFAAAGARYCVMVTKHHDGVLLWPSATPNPSRGTAWSSPRDLVGDCAGAVRAAGLRFGVYYSGGLDWTFQGLGIDSWSSLLAAIPQDDRYHAYADAHWRELMARYRPDVLWNDIGYPGFGAGAAALMADFYEANPDGVVNDRFDLIGVLHGTSHADFTTPEYSGHPLAVGRAFEVCRGIGSSFGYTTLEGEHTYLPVDELITMLVDVVADGGNLLLNVGPMASGEIPWAQQLRLLMLGQWLSVNGAAIYASRPGEPSRLVTEEGLPVRVTVGADGATYAIVCGRPDAATVSIDGLPAGTVSMLGHRGPITRRADTVVLAYRPDDTPAFTLRIERG